MLAVQLMHVEPTGEYVPARQFTQFALIVVPAVDDVPALQFSQAALPVTDLYLPAAQAVHGPPLFPVYPALHKQSCKN